MAEVAIDILERDVEVFNALHDMAEERIAALGVAHTWLTHSLDRVVLPIKSRVAIGLGIRTFEVVTGEDLTREIRVVDIVRYGAQAEKTGNFVIQLIEEMRDAARRLPDTSPELAEACQRLALAHVEGADRDTLFEAQAGAGLMNELFGEAYLSALVGDE